MPAPTVPFDYPETVRGQVAIEAFQSSGIKYATFRIDYDNGGFYQSTYTPPYIASIGGEVVQASNSVITSSPGSGGFVVSYSDPVDETATLAAAIAAVEAYSIDWDTMDKFYNDITTIGVSFRSATNIYYGRIRWKVPDINTGSYYKVTWEYYFVPETGDPSILSQDEFIWTGPGNLDDLDDPVWYSDWIDIAPPADFGTLWIKNVQFWNLSDSPYGIRPNQILMLIEPGEPAMDFSRVRSSMYQPLI